MNNLFPNNFFDKYIREAKPFIENSALQLTAFGELVCEKLDRIVDAIQGDETLNIRRTPVIVLSGADDSEEVAQVPTDQDWVLESVTVDADATTTIRLSDGPTGAARWGTTLAAAGVVSDGGNNVIFGGGTVINARSSAGDVVLYLQFRFERKKAKYRASTAGGFERKPLQDNQQEADNAIRHMGETRYVGENVIGERHHN